MRRRCLQMGGAALLFAAAILLGAALPALGQVTSEHPASMIVFPKVVFDGSRDTVIQVINNSNSGAYALCWYVNGARPFPSLPPGPFNQPLWQTTDFTLLLTRLQPTSWVASLGRFIAPHNPACADGPPFDCYGEGLDSGNVPPVAEGFEGELRCVETDAAGAPLSGNHLTGEATLTHRSSGDASKYGALGIEGFESNDGDAALLLGEEYAGCPRSWRLDHATEGAEVPGVGPGSAITTELTFVPCAADLANQVPSTVVVLLAISNELEQSFSASTSVTCWGNTSLHDINAVFDAASLGTPVAHTRIRPTVSSGSLFVLAEEMRTVAGGSVPPAAAAANVHGDETFTVVDVVNLEPAPGP